MKRVLIISARFPPVNAADIHRVRQSLPFFAQYGWVPTVVAVDPKYVENDLEKDLLATIPTEIEVHRVSALSYRWTRMFGLGSLALRSIYWFWRAGNSLIKRGSIDIVYFSTTEFPLLILGAYWKRRFGTPYIIDMQDPWLNDYYIDRPKSERPPKYWFSGRLDKFLEPIAMKRVDGIISVSQSYCDTLSERYLNIGKIQKQVIPFGGAENDFDAMKLLEVSNTVFEPGDGNTHLVYVGRGGHDMKTAAIALFRALALGLERDRELFGNVRMHFIGTDYAPRGQGNQTIYPHAVFAGVGEYVLEMTDRVSYFTALRLLTDADVLLLLGSEDSAYTASKLYPYILARRPLLAVVHQLSSVVRIMEETNSGVTIPFIPSQDKNDRDAGDGLATNIYEALARILRAIPYKPGTDWNAFSSYTSKEMTKKQVEVFEAVLDGNYSL